MTMMAMPKTMMEGMPMTRAATMGQKVSSSLSSLSLLKSLSASPLLLPRVPVSRVLEDGTAGVGLSDDVMPCPDDVMPCSDDVVPCPDDVGLADGGVCELGLEAVGEACAGDGVVVVLFVVLGAVWGVSECGAVPPEFSSLSSRPGFTAVTGDRAGVVDVVAEDVVVGLTVVSVAASPPVVVVVDAVVLVVVVVDVVVVGVGEVVPWSIFTSSS